MVGVVIGLSMASVGHASAQVGALKQSGKQKPTATVVSDTGATAATGPSGVASTGGTATGADPNAATTTSTAAPPSDTAKKHHRSFFGKAIHAVGQTSDKIQEKTGVDPKWVALNAATGGAASALKPGGMGGGIAGALTQSPLGSKLTNGSTGPMTPSSGMAPGLAGLAGGSMPAAAMATGAMRAKGMPAGGMPAGMPAGAMPGAVSAAPKSGDPTSAAMDLMAFQQEMMQLQMQAAKGNAPAQARLQQWQAITAKHQPDMIQLSQRAGSGDQTAAQQMNDLQMDMIRQWRSGETSPASGKPTSP
jgi:hypothetical protein